MTTGKDMTQTLTKSAVAAALSSILVAPAFAGEFQSNTEQPDMPAASDVESKENTFPEFWSGFYGGLSLGGNFSSAELHSNQLGFINPDGSCNVDASLSSFFPGVQFGYLHQYRSNLVVGVEADFSYNTQERSTITCPCPENFIAQDKFTARNTLQGSLRGRLGYALNSNLLPYISAGVSFADMGIRYANEGGDVYSKSATQAGWLVGAGLEWGFSDKLTVRGEYYYKAYNSLNIPVPSVYGLSDANGAGHLNFNDNTVRVALNYWF
jgi:outer membrane immunogenic protein